MPRVVTVLLMNDEEKILILKRSNKVKTYKGMWGGVAGYIEEKEKPYDTALKEIGEEIGLKENEITFVKKFEPISFTDIYNKEKYDWEVFAFLFKIKSNSKIKIDWEHSEYRWISPSEINKFDTVPKLKEIVSKIGL